jgi:DNA-binding winged helix-turn-helix (wHTH) protein
MTNLAGAQAALFRLQTLDTFRLLRLSVNGSANWEETGLGEKPCILLAVLALAGGPVPREQLCKILWEGEGRMDARNSLRQALFRIRRLLGADSVQEVPGGLKLVSPGLEVDVRPRRDLKFRGSPEAARMATRFALPRAARVGEQFVVWRTAAQRTLWSTGESPIAASGAARVRPIHHPHAPTIDWLLDLWRRVLSGNPMSIWLSASGDAARGSVITAFLERVAEGKAAIARLARGDGSYLPFALERDLAQALCPLPGAAGVSPEHQMALDAFTRGEYVAPTALRAALRDLLDAVSEEAPLLIALPMPGAYSRRALQDLVALVAQLAPRPMLLLLADRLGAPPISAQCLAVTVDGGGADGSPLLALR